MIKKIKFIAIVFLTTFGIVKSQTLEDNALKAKVQVSNTNNIGKVNLNIPLYDVSVPGYSFAASLEYLQDRLIADAQKNETTIVGTNWNLNSIGKIVTSNSSLGNVTSPQMSHWSPDGFFSAGYDNCLIPKTVSPVSKKQILDNPNSNLSSYNPNIFYFEFMGNKGYFVYDNVGKFLINSENDIFQITFNGSKCHDVFSPINEFPEFVIKDSKGNQFYFGGDYNSTDVRYLKTRYDYTRHSESGSSIFEENFYTNKQVNYLSTFYLKKIKLANNKIIDFFYRNSNKSILDSFTNGGVYVNGNYSNNIPPNNVLVNNNINLGSTSSISYYDSGGTINWTHSATTNNNYTKFAILDSIKISDNGVLHFSYTQLNTNSTKPFLQKIELKKNDKLIKKIDFVYVENNNHIYLKKLKINDGTYGFDYYDYNPSVSLNGGQLKKITYPTKGWDEFQYESNDASKEHQFNIGSFTESEAIVDRSPPMTGIGERIKEIRTYDNKGANPFVKKYNYNGDNGISSGIYDGGQIQYSKVTEEITGKEKREYYFTDIISNPDSIATKKYSDNLNIDLNYYLNTKIPLKISKSNERGRLYKIVNYDATNTAVVSKFIKYSNFLNNANPIKEISSNCTLCKVSDDRYYVVANKVQYEPSINGSTPFYIGFYQYQPVLPYLPISVRTVMITPPSPGNSGSSGSIFESHKSMKYNTGALYWHPNAVETIEYLPYPWDFTTGPQYTGKKIVTKTYYPQDLVRTNCVLGNCPTDTDQVGGKFSIYKYMVDNNIIAPVIVAQANVKGKSRLVEYQYKKNSSSSNLLQLGSQRESLLNSVFSLDTPSTAAVEEKIAYELYDNSGNLIQSTTKTGVPTTTIWGYHQTLPIAVIEGGTYSQVMGAFNLDPANPNSYLQLEIVNKSNTGTESDLINKLKEFKNKSELSSFSIKTYTHEPLVGVASATSSSGITESYKYDTSNRIEKILNADDKIVKEFTYNYAPIVFYNEKYTKDFYKNNCLSWMVGQPYTYTVPANTYMSTVSLQDAQQMAVNDANANGQNAANANGSCGFISCGFTPNYYVTMNFSSIQQTAANHISMILTYSANPPSGMSYTSGGVSVGYIGAGCRPSSIKYINSGNWRVTITPDGYVIVNALSGAPLPTQTVGFSVEYDK